MRQDAKHYHACAIDILLKPKDFKLSNDGAILS